MKRELKLTLTLHTKETGYKGQLELNRAFFAVGEALKRLQVARGIAYEFTHNKPALNPLDNPTPLL